VQTQVGARGGAGYDGGHSFANFAGGGSEYITFDARHDVTNGSAGDSFFNLEGTWRSMLKEDSSTIIPVTLRKLFGDGGIVPSRFSVEFPVDNGNFEVRTFRNG
jgi:hypothetical protein